MREITTLLFAVVVLLISCTKEKDYKDISLTGGKWKSNEYLAKSGAYVTEEIVFENGTNGYINASTSLTKGQSGSGAKLLSNFTYTKNGSNIAMNVENGKQTRIGTQNGISLTLTTDAGIEISLAKQ